MPDVFIALGSNVGDREVNIKTAIEKIRQRGIKVVKISDIIETEPYGYVDQPRFLNAVLQAETLLSPRELLNTLQEIEKEMGRERKIKWGPRNIDLDIIFYNGLIFNDEDLKIPHPDAHNRIFVIKPLAQIAEDFIHPVLKITVKEILKSLDSK
ncbi:2-amino-4-hydroxy-6-hydroxymethyldihydropteridine diphosphokinase [Thermovenabulum gondwanense]|uniref:2-amino-4-hydroxy-6-hydroxymethyldihydropteridine diphosphokinase n=1 Tax=Thermovenabulum gondwanense TaxID=520767 RepID=A0A162MKL6_9FIRM|nr:2-amino-4-hydroxy-6-hydroxymethyldihydropteridine diphosphokinase [Thermovenabulum gondwanense]KYO66493.1 Bifunctional folate synthesis protein [Thermovenabulum gondwanense]